MRVSGRCFGFEVPEGWQVRQAAEQGAVIVTADRPVGTFTPTFVLRESRLPEGEAGEQLAALTQANLAALGREIEGAWAASVDALPEGAGTGAHGERRRLWALSPAHSQSQDIVSLLMVQDLLIAHGVVAELSVTVPLGGWKPQGTLESVLDSLHPLDGGQEPPETRAEPMPVRLDERLTQRDAVPRERLAVQERRPLRLAGLNMELPRAACDAFQSAMKRTRLSRHRAFTEIASDEGRALLASGLVDEHGYLSEQGRSMARSMRRGWHWRVTKLGREDFSLQGWAGLESTFIMAAPSDAEGDDAPYRLGFCSSEDVLRIILAWTGTGPGWPMSFQMRYLASEAMRAKCQGNVPLPMFLHGDAATFAAAPWSRFLLSDDRGVTELSWISTPDYGTAITEEHEGRSTVTVTSSDPGLPFWVRLAASIITMYELNGAGSDGARRSDELG